MFIYFYIYEQGQMCLYRIEKLTNNVKRLLKICLYRLNMIPQMIIFLWITCIQENGKLQYRPCLRIINITTVHA